MFTYQTTRRMISAQDWAMEDISETSQEDEIVGSSANGILDKIPSYQEKTRELSTACRNGRDDNPTKFDYVRIPNRPEDHHIHCRCTSLLMMNHRWKFLRRLN